jgi:hypothetical protein
VRIKNEKIHRMADYCDVIPVALLAADEPSITRQQADEILKELQQIRTSLQSEDSTEGDRSFRREADHGSGRKPIRRRSEATLALRCCQDWSESSSEICPERSEGRIPLAEKGARGKGRSSFPRLSTVETVAGSAEGSETA